MKRLSFWYVHFKAALFLLICCCFFMSCENTETAIKEWTEKKIMVEEAKNINSLLSQRGVVKARMTAPLMLRYQSDTVYYEFPKSIHVDFYNDSIAVESRLNAGYAKYFEHRSTVFLRDSVVVFNIMGDTLWAPELWWDQNQQKFYTDKPVRIHTKDKRIHGKNGLEAGQNFSWYIIKGPTGTVQVLEERFPE